MSEIEHIECDADFERHLTDIGGVNYMGDPIFRMVWAQSTTKEFIGADGLCYEEYVSREPVWLLQKWMPPDAYGTPEIYYATMAPERWNLEHAEPYPEMGRYETIIKFKSTRFNQAKNRVEINTVPLDWELIEHAVPMLLEAQEMTFTERKMAQEIEKELREKQKLDRMTDQLFDALPTFYGPTSHAEITNRTALIDREIAKIEQQWKNFSPLFRKNMPRGFFQKN